MQRVLVIEDNEGLRESVLLALHKGGVPSEAIGTVGEALGVLSKGGIDVIVLGPSGGELADLLDQHGDVRAPDVLVLVPGNGARGDEGLRALRQGATDFVPVRAGADELLAVLRKVEARRQFKLNQRHAPTSSRAKASGAEGRGLAGATGENGRAAVVAKPTGGRRKSPVFIGTSPKMLAVLSLIRRVAAVRVSVLVGGESGTGKELVAEALHDQSPWRTGPFVAVNCGAIPGGLIESELFGHVRGSFTDAVRDKQGLFQAADGGTLFLDEIADLPLALQPKLLRALQEGVVRAVGDVEDARVDVRVVAATARDLRNEVAAGRFREDLYYRLAALTIEIPALRERRDDIPALAEHFLGRARARLGVAVTEIDPEALRLLTSYRWPGNVRELENTIERAAVLCSGARVDVASLPERMQPSVDVIPSSPTGGDGAAGLLDPNELSIKQASRRIEEELIRRALRATGGNRTRAAEHLEISHRALLYKIKEYGITVASGRDAAGREANKHGPGGRDKSGFGDGGSGPI